MYTILILLTASILLLILTGLYLEFRPRTLTAHNKVHIKRGLGLNLLLFSGGLAVMMFMGIEDVMAAVEASEVTKEISTGLGLALLGIGLPTGLATIGAGIAVSSVGAASLAVITEKPEMFGRTLIYLGLAEGIAIYGLVMSILLLGKI
ncbi:MAG: ATPase [Gammaproteobacteria bacterium]|nr:ATP synthase subunit C [Gammaproteobacteria bacterium]NNJ91717.1 ATPase [Gammaproteobacteria bacterium]